MENNSLVAIQTSEHDLSLGELALVVAALPATDAVVVLHLDVGNFGAGQDHEPPADMPSTHKQYDGQIGRELLDYTRVNRRSKLYDGAGDALLAGMHGALRVGPEREEEGEDDDGGLLHILERYN